VRLRVKPSLAFTVKEAVPVLPAAVAEPPQAFAAPLPVVVRPLLVNPVEVTFVAIVFAAAGEGPKLLVPPE